MCYFLFSLYISPPPQAPRLGVCAFFCLSLFRSSSFASLWSLRRHSLLVPYGASCSASNFSPSFLLLFRLRSFLSLRPRLLQLQLLCYVFVGAASRRRRQSVVLLFPLGSCLPPLWSLGGEDTVVFSSPSGLLYFFLYIMFSVFGVIYTVYTYCILKYVPQIYHTYLIILYYWVLFSLVRIETKANSVWNTT